MPKIDIPGIEKRSTTGYPAPFNAVVTGREKQALGDAVGLSQFGVNLTRLKPGAASALMHWHLKEDEFVYILEGEAVLQEGDQETVLKAGEAAGFKAGDEVGHRLINWSDRDCLLLEVGTRTRDDACTYTDEDVDLAAVKVDGAWDFRRKDGSAL